MKLDTKPIQYRKFREGKWEVIESGVIVESPVSLTVNGEIWLTFMCTPNNLEALAAGFLFNEGIIQTLSEIADLRVCASGENIDVWLNRGVEKPEQWKRTSGCTGGVTTVDVYKASPELLNGFTLNAQSVGGLIDDLLESQELYRQVGGVHTSVLTDGNDHHIVAEDIGRHNTIDKIAFALNEISTSRKKIFLPPAESARKCYKKQRASAQLL
jgi:FdhD protein